MSGALARLVTSAVLAATVAVSTAGPVAARSWRPLGAGLPQEGQWRQGFQLADLDGDGRLDLVHGPARRGDGRPVVFLGAGTGSFAPWREARFPDLPFDYGDVTAADFDGDGFMDIALGSHLRGLTVLRGDGQGLFERWDEGLRLDTTGEAFASRAVQAVDWNGDGRQDLVALGEGPSPGASADEGSWGLRVYLNGGDIAGAGDAATGGSWSAIEAAEPGRIFGYSLAVGDADGDGRPDVVTSSRSQGRLAVVHVSLADGGIARRDLNGARAGSVLHAVTMLDFDRDGIDDVAAAYLAKDPAGTWRAGVDIYPARSDGGRREVLALEDSLEISVVAAGDFNADGLTDVVAGGTGGRIWILRGTRDGGFDKVGSSKIERSARGCKASHAEFADLDDRAGDELVISFAGEPVADEVCPSGGSIQVWQYR